jgi:hypothetical protein
MASQAPTVKVTPKKVPVRKKMTMQGLWRMTLWAATAASALLIAVLTTRSEVGAQRVAFVVSSLSGSSAAGRTFDAQGETRRLSEAVRGLAAENDRLKSRLATVEHNLDDMTGSIGRQIEAVKTELLPQTEPLAEPPPVAAAPALTTITPAPAVDGRAVLAAPRATPPAAAREPTDIAPAATAETEFGVDLGSAASIQVLRDRWLGIRSAHADLFKELAPTVTLRKISRSNHVELRLVVGPLANREAAAQLCASLAPFRLACQPTAFDRDHLALR